MIARLFFFKAFKHSSYYNYPIIIKGTQTSLHRISGPHHVFTIMLENFRLWSVNKNQCVSSKHTLELLESRTFLPSTSQDACVLLCLQPLEDESISSNHFLLEDELFGECFPYEQMPSRQSRFKKKHVLASLHTFYLLFPSRKHPAIYLCFIWGGWGRDNKSFDKDI